MASILFVDIVGDTMAWAQTSAVGQRPTASGWGRMPSELSVRTAHDIGLWLLDHLVKSGVKAENTIFSVGRSRTNVKYLRIPPGH